MKQFIKKVRPASGFSGFLHIVFTIILPLLAYVLVRTNLLQLAIAVVLLSKWRVFAVRPRHWLAYIRANAVDIMAGLSFVIFMSETNVIAWQLVWTVAYAIWLLVIKPSSTDFGISAQAYIAQSLGLVALFLAWGSESIGVLMVGVWGACNFSARHFLSSFEDPFGRFLANYWALFGASLTWVLGHWLLYYGLIAQPALLLSVLGFGLGSIYYLKNSDKLTTLMKRQIIFAMIVVVVVVILFSDWADKAI